MVSTPQTFAQAVGKVIARVHWPPLSNLEPPFLILDDNNPHKSSVAAQAIRGLPHDSRVPSLLLTKLETDDDAELAEIDFGHGPSMSYTQGQRSAVEHLSNSVNIAGVACLVGVSGSGKTRLLYQLAWRRWVNFFVANTAGNGGAGDMALLEQAATRMGSSSTTVPSCGDALIRMTSCLVGFRIKFLEAALAHYGDALQPRHWAMMQLYPTAVLSEDPFAAFAASLGDVEKDPAVGGRYFYQLFQSQRKVKCNVLDEAQRFDDMLPGSFPSSQMGKPPKSLLGPVTEGLWMQGAAKPLLSGTGLRARNAYEIGASPKYGTITVVRCVTTYFDERRVKDMLGWSGVAVPPTQDLEGARGRARWWATLAEKCLESGLSLERCFADWEREVSDIPRVFLARLRNIDPATVQVNHTHAATFSGSSVYDLLRAGAVNYVLGGEGLLDTTEMEALISAGVSAVRRSTGGSRFVVDEPLVVKALVKDPWLEFEHMLQHSASGVGFEFEEYVVLKAESVLAFLTQKIAGVAGDYAGEWKYMRGSSGRVAVRALSDHAEAALLDEILRKRSSCAVLPFQTCGPDIVLVFWDEHSQRYLIVLIQCKSGKASTPDAMKSLRHLYGRGLQEGTSSSSSAAPSLTLEDLLSSPNARLVRLVIKPLSGSRDNAPRMYEDVANGVLRGLEVVVDASNKNELVGMEKGLASLAAFKADAAVSQKRSGANTSAGARKKVQGVSFAGADSASSSSSAQPPAQPPASPRSS